MKQLQLKPLVRRYRLDGRVNVEMEVLRQKDLWIKMLMTPTPRPGVG
jgi:hypothetical protein